MPSPSEIACHSWASAPGATEVLHCNTYRLRDGKITEVHEYASSPLWWLNLVMQLVLGRVRRRTTKRLRS